MNPFYFLPMMKTTFLLKTQFPAHGLLSLLLMHIFSFIHPLSWALHSLPFVFVSQPRTASPCKCELLCLHNGTPSLHDHKSTHDKNIVVRDELTSFSFFARMEKRGCTAVS